jgi:N-acetylglutamate synthase-like GNAT family acetyltransferase
VLKLNEEKLKISQQILKLINYYQHRKILWAWVQAEVKAEVEQIVMVNQYTGTQARVSFILCLDLMVMASLVYWGGVAALKII